MMKKRVKNYTHTQTHLHVRAIRYRTKASSEIIKRLQIFNRMRQFLLFFLFFVIWQHSTLFNCVKYIQNKLPILRLVFRLFFSFFLYNNRIKHSFTCFYLFVSYTSFFFFLFFGCYMLLLYVYLFVVHDLLSFDITRLFIINEKKIFYNFSSGNGSSYCSIWFHSIINLFSSPFFLWLCYFVFCYLLSSLKCFDSATATTKSK